MISRNIFSWIVEVQVPYHHKNISRWQIIMIEATTGRNLIEDWCVNTKEEADAAIDSWTRTHPNDVVRQIVENTSHPIATPGVRRGDPMLSPFYLGDI